MRLSAGTDEVSALAPKGIARWRAALPIFICSAWPLLFPVHPSIGWAPGGAPQSWHPEGGDAASGWGAGQDAQIQHWDGLGGRPPPAFDFQLCSSLLKGGIYLHAKSKHSST